MIETVPIVTGRARLNKIETTLKKIEQYL